jgi:hypothetical protein
MEKEGEIERGMDLDGLQKTGHAGGEKRPPLFPDDLWVVASVLNFAGFARQTPLSVAHNRRNCRTICRKVLVLIFRIGAAYDLSTERIGQHALW